MFLSQEILSPPVGVSADDACEDPIARPHVAISRYRMGIDSLPSETLECRD
jgi:hypothetical protein